MNSRLLLVLIVATLAFPVAGQSANANFWYDLSGLGGSFFQDPNTGQTGYAILDLPMGGRYESMGRAYTAMTGDWGFFFANPAGSSFMDHTEFVLLHSDWIDDSNVEGVLYGTSYDYFGLGVAGKVLYLPFQEKGPWGADEAQVYYSEGTAVLNTSYRFAADYYFPGLSWGANLKFAYRNMPEIIYPDQFFSVLLLDTGVVTRFNFAKPYPSRDKNFSAGLMVKNLGLPPINNPDIGDYGEALPTEASAGVSYSPLRPLVIAVDFNYPFFLYPYMDIDPNGNVVRVNPEKWNLAGGFDLSITPFFALQGGFGWDGGNPRLSMGSTIDLTDVSFQVNYTLDLSTQVNRLDRFSLNASFNLGDWGRARDRADADRLYADGLLQYSQGNLAKAIDLWEAVANIDSRYTPALQALAVAREQQRLQQEIRDLGEIKIAQPEDTTPSDQPAPPADGTEQAP